MKISAVIFDMDGLMFATERISQRAWVRAAADYGYTYPEYVYQSVIGRARPDVERITMQAFGEDFPFEAVYTTKQRYMQETLERDGIPLKPGLISLLNWLSDHSIAVAVASSSPRAVVLRNLRIAVLELERFVTIVGGDEVLHGKPAPDIFLEAARRMGVIPQGCLVLEDSNAGIQAAHAAGMQAVMIPDMKLATIETRNLAFRVVDSLTRVQDLLDGHG
jgi:HAD superfamily hydrolase (TIGR01509 family)